MNAPSHDGLRLLASLCHPFTPRRVWSSVNLGGTMLEESGWSLCMEPLLNTQGEFPSPPFHHGPPSFPIPLPSSSLIMSLSHATSSPSHASSSPSHATPPHPMLPSPHPPPLFLFPHIVQKRALCDYKDYITQHRH